MKHITTKTAGLLTAAALALSLTACGVNAATDNTATTNTTVETTTENVTEAASAATPDSRSSATAKGKSDGRVQMDENTKLGSVTAVDGTTVTVTLMDRGGRGRQRPDGSDQQTPPDLPDGAAAPDTADQQTPPDLPDGAAAPDGTDQQTPPDLPDGAAPDTADQQAPSDGSDAAATTITLDLSLITKDGAAVTEVSVGDRVMVTLDEDGSPVSAQVMQFDRQGPQGQQGPQNRQGRPDRSGQRAGDAAPGAADSGDAAAPDNAGNNSAAAVTDGADA